jgi:hypothetical protein
MIFSTSVSVLPAASAYVRLVRRMMPKAARNFTFGALAFIVKRRCISIYCASSSFIEYFQVSYSTRLHSRDAARFYLRPRCWESAVSLLVMIPSLADDSDKDIDSFISLAFFTLPRSREFTSHDTFLWQFICHWPSSQYFIK